MIKTLTEKLLSEESFKEVSKNNIECGKFYYIIVDLVPIRVMIGGISSGGGSTPSLRYATSDLISSGSNKLKGMVWNTITFKDDNDFNDFKIYSDKK